MTVAETQPYYGRSRKWTVKWHEREDVRTAPAGGTGGEKGHSSASDHSPVWGSL